MDDEKVWTYGDIECDICTHKWIAVYHIESDKLECPNCGYMTNYE